MVGFRWWFALFLGCFLCQVPASHAEEALLRPVMHRVYDAIAYLLPASLDEHAMEDPLQQAEIRRQLAALLAASSDLERHVEQRDVSFRHLGASLATDVRLAVDLFDAGSYEAAGSQLGGLMQNCIACHQKLPTARQNPLASRLLDRPEITGLPGVERARIYVAVRRFDGALREWERGFADPNTSAWHFDLNGSLREYLAVAIRVQGEFERARKTLDALAKRADAPDYLVVRLRDWSTSLEDLEELAMAESSLETARKLIRKANERSLYPETRGRLVHDLIASRHLNRVIASLDPDDARLAEAYYLLGIVEARSVDSFWIPQAELHLTAAIYADPKGPFARSAYLALEEYLVVGEGGIASAQADAALERLRGLREMVEVPPADSSRGL